MKQIRYLFFLVVGAFFIGVTGLLEAKMEFHYRCYKLNNKGKLIKPYEYYDTAIALEDWESNATAKSIGTALKRCSNRLDGNAIAIYKETPNFAHSQAYELVQTTIGGASLPQYIKAGDAGKSLMSKFFSKESKHRESELPEL